MYLFLPCSIYIYIGLSNNEGKSRFYIECRNLMLQSAIWIALCKLEFKHLNLIGCSPAFSRDHPAAIQAVRTGTYVPFWNFLYSNSIPLTKSLSKTNAGLIYKLERPITTNSESKTHLIRPWKFYFIWFDYMNSNAMLQN